MKWRERIVERFLPVEVREECRRARGERGAYVGGSGSVNFLRLEP